MRPVLIGAPILLLSLGCLQPAVAPAASSEMRTIENTPMNAIPVQPPPTLDERIAEIRPLAGSAETTGAAANRQEELSRKMNLPFTPAIAMDPVDGSKLSIGADTPLHEHKDRLYYFSSAKNKQAFVANPAAYLKGRLSSY